MEELERLRDACVTYREKALIEFLVSSGCRLNEVAQLSASDLDLMSRSVQVTGKGDKELFDALTKDAAGIWKNPQQEPVKVPGVTGSWADSDNNERMMRKVMGLPIAKGE